MLRGRPGLIWIAPPLLAAIFGAASAMAGAFSVPLMRAMVLAACRRRRCYACLCKALGPVGTGATLDFAAILLIWLPIELERGPAESARATRRVSISGAWNRDGALVIGYRTVDGLKYNLPRARRNFVGCRSRPSRSPAPVLAALGIAIGFIPAPSRWPWI